MTAVPASAATLKGDWAPFSRCPVDDPAMLAADGSSTVDLCIASHSASGTIKLGSITATTGASDLQLGLLSGASGLSLVSPSGGAIVSDPVKVPGGLLGLMCPSKLLLVAQLCQKATDNSLNNVFATVEPAGTPSDFNLGAGLGSGQPILTLPVKIHLQNPLLAATCTIGTDSNPILLKPENLTSPTAGITRFDGDGTDDPTNGVLLRIGVSGASQGDNSFAVPAATGCGLLGLANTAINLKSGLPSPAGKNSLVLNDPSTFLAGFNIPSDFAPNSGQQLSGFWHSAQS
ncbi:MAG: hypothetical protein J2P32_05015 [Actinobacteria bacterium]|nr:hypothetical protein [Actinomycetota bacterium]